MRKCYVFNIFDTVSETWLGNFFANSYNHATVILKQFLDKNPFLDWHDLRLCKVSSFDSPFSPEALDKLEEVDLADDFGGSDDEESK